MWRTIMKWLKWGLIVWGIIAAVVFAVYEWPAKQADGSNKVAVASTAKSAASVSEAPAPQSAEASKATPTPKGPTVVTDKSKVTFSASDISEMQISFGLVPKVPPTAESPPIVLSSPEKGTYAVGQTDGIPDQPKFATSDEKAASRKTEGELVSQMFSPYVSKEVRVSSAQDLGNFPYGRVAKALSAVLSKDKDSEVRCAAAKSLGKVANASFLPFLKKVAEADPDQTVREETAESIKKILARANIPSG